MTKLAVIFGTRPEAIKLAPVILALKRDADITCEVCVTGQHREMLDQMLEVFGIVPDVDLDLMVHDQTLADLTARSIVAVERYLAKSKPDMVLVQGDTTTVFCSSLAAFYRRVPVGHVEAGLRTGNFNAPWPEEMNRVLTSHLASLHFAPTEWARQNLLKEHVPDETIFVTGNTVVDALFFTLDKVRSVRPHIEELPEFLQPNSPDNNGGPRVVLITGHRRENFGNGFESICTGIAKLARRFPEVHFVYPVHLNPNVREPVLRILGEAAQNGTGSGGRNVHLIKPLPYLPFAALMERATLLLTDSGGVQEEAPSLGRPVLVMRETTERPEAITAGTARLIGMSSEKILEEVSRLLTDSAAYEKMSRAHNPYGDGRAGSRIVEACRTFLGIGQLES